MYKVFIKDKPLYLVEKFEHNELSHGTFFLKYHGKHELQNLLCMLEEYPTLRRIYVQGDSLPVLWDDFVSLHNVVEAAGGLVWNNKNNLLFIKRHGKWDLPKGKLEKGEKPEQAAVREVMEECGIDEIENKGFTGTTYHVYLENGLRILKKTYWYNMSVDGQQELTPQEEEGITSVEWKLKDKLEEVKKNTYASLLDLFRTVGI